MPGAKLGQPIHNSTTTWHDAKPTTLSPAPSRHRRSPHCPSTTSSLISIWKLGSLKRCVTPAISYSRTSQPHNPGFPYPHVPFLISATPTASHRFFRSMTSSAPTWQDAHTKVCRPRASPPRLPFLYLSITSTAPHQPTTLPPNPSSELLCDNILLPRCRFNLVLSTCTGALVAGAV